MFSCQLKRGSQSKQRDLGYKTMAHDTLWSFFGVAGLTSDLICLPLHGFSPIGQSSSPLRDCETQTPDHYGSYPLDIRVAPAVHRLSSHIHVSYRSWRPLTARQLLYAELSDAANRHGHVNYRASVLRCDTHISAAESLKNHIRRHLDLIAARVSFLCHLHAQQYPRQVTTLSNLPWASRPIHLRTRTSVSNALRSRRHHDNA